MDTNYKSSAYNRSLTLSPCRLCYRDECGFPSTCQGDPWKSLLPLVQRADCTMYKHRREDLDLYFRYGIIMLTFNGPILMDSYKWITNKPSYSFIAQLCNHNSSNDALFISYHAALATVALWATSLLFTSASLLMCHLGRQWLREFMNQPQFSHKNQLAFRQIHYDSLCQWDFFDVCDMIPLLLPLGATFFIAGLIVFLGHLNHPDAYIFIIISCVFLTYYIIIAVHPLYCFLTASQDGLTSELSPFRSPSSWFFFKLVMNCFNRTSYLTLRKRALLKLRRGARLPLHSRFGSPSRTKSIDWLEQDCYLFMQGDNASEINTPLINALIWIDSNPTIEKTTKVVISVYHCISDLNLPSILPHFKEICTRSESGLAGVITDASQRCADMNDTAITAFVLKSWLELHVTRLPELRTQLAELQLHCMKEIGKRIPDYARLGINSFNAFFIQGRRLPVKQVFLLLVAAKTGLANSMYHEGTFKLIFQVIFQLRDSASERQVSLVLAILAECKHFAYSFRGSGDSGLDEQQARKFMSELVEFLSNFQAIDCDFDLTNGQWPWSPHSSDRWKEIITIANEVYSIASLGFLNTFPASPTELVDPHSDGVSPVSTKESFNSRQSGTNDVGVESATKASTTPRSTDASSYPEPEAFISIDYHNVQCVFSRTDFHPFPSALPFIDSFDNSMTTHTADPFDTFTMV